MDDEEEQRRYEEALQREYVKLKVELAQVQSDTERHKLMSTQLSSETDQLRSAIAQSQNAEREMRDLAKQLADEVSKLQREVKSKEEERDQVKAEAERTQEQRAQLEKTLEVLGGRKVTELLNSRRRISQSGCSDQDGESSDEIQASRRNLLNSSASGTQHRESRGIAGGVSTTESSASRDAGSASSDQINGQSIRGSLIDRPSLSGPNASLFEKEESSELGDSHASRGASGRTVESAESRRSVGSGLSSDSLRMSVRDFMRGLDNEC
mmetsp:Transcript_20957/g.39282  ORF Transcript_20957/g.39282 Transcript_20957/m.39282 type:complete len:268 (-) Transcript_20957:28-831(-)